MLFAFHHAIDGASFIESNRSPLKCGHNHGPLLNVPIILVLQPRPPCLGAAAFFFISSGSTQFYEMFSALTLSIRQLELVNITMMTHNSREKETTFQTD